MVAETDAGQAQKADTLFLSYTHEEAPMAEAIVTTLKENFDNLNIFDWKSTEHVSADWLEKLKFELGQAKAVVFLLSPDSIRKQWILFEYGASWFSAGNKLLIPIFHSGLGPSQLDPPLSSIQGISADNADFGAALSTLITKNTSARLKGQKKESEIQAAIQKAVSSIAETRQRYDVFISAPMANSSWLDLKENKGWWKRVSGESGEDSERFRKELERSLVDAVEKLQAQGCKVRYGGMDTQPNVNRVDKVRKGIEALKVSNAYVLVYPAKLASGALCEAGFAAAMGIDTTYYIKDGLIPPTFLDATGAAKNMFTSGADLSNSLIEKFGRRA